MILKILIVVLCCCYVAKETVYNEVVHKIQKLQEILSKDQATWENEKAKLNMMLSEKDQCIAVRTYFILCLHLLATYGTPSAQASYYIVGSCQK